MKELEAFLVAADEAGGESEEFVLDNPWLVSGGFSSWLVRFRWPVCCSSECFCGGEADTSFRCSRKAVRGFIERTGSDGQRTFSFKGLVQYRGHPQGY